MTQDQNQNGKGSPDNWESGQSIRRGLDKDDAPIEDIVGGPLVDNNDDKDPVPVLPPAPTDWFSEITNEILGLTDQLASVALSGSIGVGKSFVARTVLDHDRTKAKFGENRHFMGCDDLKNTLDGFLERVSDAIHTTPTQLGPCLRSSPPLILLLDGIDCVLDPLAPEAEEICAMIEEFSRFENICLVTTSRMYANIHGFQRVEVPTPPEGHARDVFYNLCNLARSPPVDTLIAKLDFHLFSIELIARTIRENSWDEEMLVKAWDDHTSLLRTSYYQRLKDTIEPAFRSPRINGLGTLARDVLGAIASFQSGVGEHQLEGIFRGTGGVREVVDVLCKFSLIHRRDGVLTMLSPLKFYFLESMIVYAETVETIRWGPDCMPARGVFPAYTQGPPDGWLLHPSPLRPTILRDIEYLPRKPCPPVLTLGPPESGPSYTAPHPKASRRERIGRVKRKLLALFGQQKPPAILIETQEDTANIPPSASQEDATNIPLTAAQDDHANTPPTVQEDPETTSPAAAQENLPAETPPTAYQQQISPAPVPYEVDETSDRSSLVSFYSA